MKMNFNLEPIKFETNGSPPYLDLCIFVVVVLTFRLAYLFFKIHQEYSRFTKPSTEPQTPANEIVFFYLQFKEKISTRLYQIRLLIYISVLVEIYALLHILMNFSMSIYGSDHGMEDFIASITIHIIETVFATTVFLIFWILITGCYFFIKRKYLSVSFEIDQPDPHKDISPGTKPIRFNK
jgi:hypothetical protein